ncbi:MAG: response regulator [Rhodomicrobium sp.]
MTLAGKRVLVVEDEMLITLEIVDELKNAGCTVIGPGRRLEAAIALARGEELDAAVLDVNLAGHFVWPAAEALASRNVPFMFLTGFGPELEFPPEFAAARRLEKPVMPGSVAEALAVLFSSL